VEEVDDLALHIACGRASVLGFFKRTIALQRRQHAGVFAPKARCNDQLHDPFSGAKIEF
jgi:hypothetical protein